VPSAEPLSTVVADGVHRERGREQAGTNSPQKILRGIGHQVTTPPVSTPPASYAG